VVEGALIRHVAVKLILPDVQYFQRQLTELVAATNLRHDHLAACFHAGSAMLGQLKVLYPVMDVAQGTLQQCELESGERLLQVNWRAASHGEGVGVRRAQVSGPNIPAGATYNRDRKQDNNNGPVHAWRPGAGQ
jgi:hypothetical protein